MVQSFWSHSTVFMSHHLPLSALLPGCFCLQTLLGCRELDLAGGFGFVLTLYLCLCPSLAHPGLLSMLTTFLLHESDCASWCPSPLTGYSEIRNSPLVGACDSGTSVGQGEQGQSHSCGSAAAKLSVPVPSCQPPWGTGVLKINTAVILIYFFPEIKPY